jgi:hypothetical protein
VTAFVSHFVVDTVMCVFVFEQAVVGEELYRVLMSRIEGAKDSSKGPSVVRCSSEVLLLPRPCRVPRACGFDCRMRAYLEDQLMVWLSDCRNIGMDMRNA